MTCLSFVEAWSIVWDISILHYSYDVDDSPMLMSSVKQKTTDYYQLQIVR